MEEIHQLQIHQLEISDLQSMVVSCASSWLSGLLPHRCGTWCCSIRSFSANVPCARSRDLQCEVVWFIKLVYFPHVCIGFLLIRNTLKTSQSVPSIKCTDNDLDLDSGFCTASDLTRRQKGQMQRTCSPCAPPQVPVVDCLHVAQ